MNLGSTNIRPSIRCCAPLLTRRRISIDYLLSSIPQNNPPAHKKRKPLSQTSSKDLALLIINTHALNNHFRSEHYSAPTKKQITETQSFFNRSKYTLDWTIGKYEEIPDIKFKLLKAERDEKYSKMEAYGKSQYHDTFFTSKKSFGIKPELLKPLPEVLILGHTNVGKSSLINNLLLDKEENKTAYASTEHAFVSKRAGYTKTLNCFNVGNKIRLIDSPGYGEFGESAQGELVMDYIRERNLLRRAFILIDSIEGFREEDLILIDHLIEEGIAFEIIFTKVDEVIRRKFSNLKVKLNYKDAQQKANCTKSIEGANQAVVEHYNKLISLNGMDSIVTLPKLLFNNAETNKFTNMRHGYKEIRFAILQSCGVVQE